MNKQPAKKFETRLDQAIDNLNAERSPLLFEDDDRELIDLVDTARLVRVLREPSHPGDDFAIELASRLETNLQRPLPANGHVSDVSLHMMPVTIDSPPSRGRAGVRILLVAAAALLRTGGIGLVAGIIAGIIAGGIGGRIVMRISGALFERANPLAPTVTQSSGRVVGEITAGGTVELVVFGGILFGIFGGIAYVVVRPWLPWSGWRRGMLFGALLLATFGTMVIKSDNEDFARFGPPLLNIAMFGLIFVAFGAIVAPLVDYLERDFSRDRPTRAGSVRLGARYLIIAVAWLASAPLVLGSFLDMIFGNEEGTPTVDRIDVAMFYFIVVVGLLTRLFAAHARRDGSPTISSTGSRHQVVASTATMALALPVLIGLILIGRTIFQILTAP